MRWTRLGLTPAEDVVTTYLDFQNFTAGAPDDTWTDTDFSNLETLLDNFQNSIKPYIWSKYVLAEYRWYRIGPGVLPPNPPVRITARSIAGTASNPLPPQCAMTLTKKTAARRQWGRMYLPISSASMMDNAGRINGPPITVIADAAHTLTQGAAAMDMQPVVYSPTRSKAYALEHWQADDLWDVIRSRRFDKPLIREIRP